MGILSLNLAIRSLWSEPQSAPGLVFADCIKLLCFGCKEYNESDFSIDHLVMSICRIFSCVVGKGCLLWQIHCLGKTLLAFDLLHFVLQGQMYLLLQVSLTSYICILVPGNPLYWSVDIMVILAWRIPWTEEPGGLQSMGSQRVRHDWATLLSLSFLEGLVGLHRTIQLQLLQHYWSGHRHGLPWYRMVSLGNEPRSICRFWGCTQALHFRLFCWLWGATPFLLRDSCP